MSTQQQLGFSVRVARCASDLHDACTVRSSSYGHHLPSIKATWAEPDDLDMLPDTTVLIARDKASRQAVGTVRIATNKSRPLQIEGHVDIPPLIGKRPLAEITRLGVLPGHPDPAVKLGLMKGLYLYCIAHQVQWMVIGARSDGLVRQYRRLGFTDLVDEGLTVPFPHAGGLLHRVLAFHVTSAERNWHAMNHPLHRFMVCTYHPDIAVFDPVDDGPAPNREHRRRSAVITL